jgi:hypothetical protein
MGKISKKNFENCFLWSRYGTGTVTCQKSEPESNRKKNYGSATLSERNTAFEEKTSSHKAAFFI